MRVLSRVLLISAGVIGAAGVAAAAAASHEGSRNLSALSTIYLAHGPALLALAFLAQGRMLVGSGALLAFGTLLFGVDLTLREWLGHAVFPGAAPLGGAAMILAWLGIAIAGAVRRR
ncbi:Uncharacterized membrane protein YgdD, TMEM256/DUF423 family [Devosia lucknowensis]|uniref:Uncharacterized membrane protein YgdD, TMEM256/DUF423 family n=1 Tax=Devosia lucknowensis TaxID=1096929 RepID=A0A1Y6F6I9_9HYPH|nr:DUF423 domain-containing protein [Devosia lucknowensis]SMQ68970.1 Uncharacterized membrane protein YgdD, TMEM256/DUF423 family [Devosia lucknowensis]